MPVNAIGTDQLSGIEEESDIYEAFSPHVDTTNISVLTETPPGRLFCCFFLVFCSVFLLFWGLPNLKIDGSCVVWGTSRCCGGSVVTAETDNGRLPCAIYVMWQFSSREAGLAVPVCGSYTMHNGPRAKSSWAKMLTPNLPTNVIADGNYLIITDIPTYLRP